MEKCREKREWGEKVSRLGGKVRIEKVLTDKVAPGWKEKKVQGEEKARGEGKASGEKRSQGKERVSKGGGRGFRRGRGEGQDREEQLSKDQGKGRVDKERVEELGWVEEQGRNKAGKQREEQTPGEKKGRGQGKGRGVGKVWAEDPEKGEARYRTRYQGSSHVARCPAMYPAGPAWPKLRVLRAMWALLAVLLAPGRLWAKEDIQECIWHVVLIKFEAVGEEGRSDRFFDLEPLETLDSVFSLLVDAPTDQNEKYLGFPYYLKINYSCGGESSEAQVRKGHLTGLKPLVLVTFQSPVNFHRWKIEQLQIQMEGAPFRSKERCNAEEVCAMSWYTPMPIKNGSVVMYVDVSSNGLGPFIQNKRFHVNINGFLQKQQDNTLQFTVGNEIFNLIPRYFINVPSRPLWHTVDQTPVLILGGIPDEKSVLLTDTSFTDFFLVELNIDSCWVGSFYCPQASFTATIYDAIATESTLFIRQNQLVYYFTGTYVTLHESNQGSGSWVRVLANECIKKLCPVHAHSNGSEYVMALTTGKREGYVHFGTITDGRVSFELLPRQRSVCEGLQVMNCSIIWAVFIAGDYNLLLLVQMEDPTTKKYFQVVSYDLVGNHLAILYTIPEFIPDARGLEFLMLLGTESHTTFLMVPKGMFYNQYSNLLYIWGNFLLQSYNYENFIYLADFPKEQSIKYLVNSFHGDMAIVTETEEIWYLLEGSYRMYKLFPSRGWEVHINLQVMHQSSVYTPNETMVTLFYEDTKLYQLVYLMKNQQGQLVKRHVPVEQLLMYQQLSNHYFFERQGSHLTLSFTNFCPFSVMRLRDLPNPQVYSRQERYRARPPRVVEPSGFHSENSLAVYQGLVYYLLCLHSEYHKPYADPVHDSTWRWSNKKQDQDYYFYLASNSQSPGNVYIDMASYEKIYDLKADYELPERIFLDKGTSYVFSVFLRVGEQSLEFTPERVLTSEELKSTVDLGVVLADPGCIEAVVRQKFLINRNSVLFRVTLSDKRSCFDQGLSGHHLLETSMLLKVAGAVGHCFQNTHQGPRMWLCLENSPCYDTIPHTIFAPEFFFKVLVSNRGVDKSTYCDYQLIFLLHIHGLPLSAKRAFFILVVSSSVFIGLVTLYIIFCLLLPVMVKAWNSLRWKINNIIMSESYYTYTSPSRNCSGTSETRSTVSSRVGSSDSSKVAEANQRAPEQTWKKKPLVT
ncbi:cation channel sperm-associated auxiliary subunit gamma isoform X4 [Prionailurus viverrinus]|uniref:cation channel sperm-associated auxiliary subunit gamma isoform X4 n=1 Tax=Prionailurus viverrinus TaxID=61388 RepID=UPI001FF6A6AD|nr:cation channel sperm-associated auxiliary subunit gamma isoform X4 [Prionailurus viverrinus]